MFDVINFANERDDLFRCMTANEVIYIIRKNNNNVSVYLFIDANDRCFEM